MLDYNVSLTHYIPVESVSCLYTEMCGSEKKHIQTYVPLYKMDMRMLW